MRYAMALFGTLGLLVSGCGGEADDSYDPAADPQALSPRGEGAPIVTGDDAPDALAFGYDFAGFSGKVRGINDLGKKLGATGCVTAIVPVGVSPADPAASARDAVSAMVGHAHAEVVKGKEACVGACGKALLDRLGTMDQPFSLVLSDLASAVSHQSAQPAELTLWSGPKASRAVTLHGTREGRVFGLAYFYDARDCR